MTDAGPPPLHPDVGEHRLERRLGLWLAIAVVINATIGTGIFKTPAKIARLTGAVPALFLVWIAGAVIAICGALTLAELAAAHPRSGGVYEYLRRAWGRHVAFVFGWTKLTLLIPSAVGSFARLAGEALASLLGLAPGSSAETALALVVLVGCVAVNVLGIRQAVIQQAILTALKYVGVAVLAVIGIGAALGGGGHVVAPPLATGPGPSLLGAFGALVSVMWVYDGWADLTSVAGEVRDPARTLPRALITGTLAIAAVYLLTNVGYVLVLGLDGLRGSTTGANMAAGNLVRAALGPEAWTGLTVLLVISCVGGCMSSLLTGARVFVPMASDGVFVRGLGTVSTRAHVPVRAVLVAGALGALYVCVRSFEQLTDGFVCGYFPFYSLAVLAVFRLRRRAPTAARPFRVPGYPVVPLVFVVGATCLMIGAFADADHTALFAGAVVALGVPLAWLWLRPARSAR
ncbi:MAG: APC family permease [Myxococcales bacterium]|nr:APC family permease [Myxococcales bacterium]